MEEQIIQNQKESIKLLKMSKGYNWEIKVFINSVPALAIKDKIISEDNEAIKRLEEIDKELREKFKEEIQQNKLEKKKP